MFSPSRFPSAVASRALRDASGRRRHPRLIVAAVSAALGLIMVAAIAVTVPRASATQVPGDDGGPGALSSERAGGLAQRDGSTSGERALRQPAQDTVTLDQAPPPEPGGDVGGRRPQREADERTQLQAPEPGAIDQPTSSRRQGHIGVRRSGLQGREASEQEAAALDPVDQEQQATRGQKAGRPLQQAQSEAEAALPLAGVESGDNALAGLVVGDGASNTGKKSARQRDGLGAVALAEPLALGVAGGTGGGPGTPHKLALSPEAQALPQGPLAEPGVSSLLLKGIAVFLGWGALSGCPPLPKGRLICGVGAVGAGLVAIKKDGERIRLAEQQDGTQFGPHRAAMVEKIWVEWLAAAVLGGIGRMYGPFWLLAGSLAGPWVGNFVAGNWGPSNQRLRELTTPAVPQAPLPEPGR